MRTSEDLYVILADVVNSRNITDRTGFDRQMGKAVAALNQELGTALKLPLRAWKGLDEIAAVTSKPRVLYQLADRLNSILAPAQIRLAVVKGQLDIVPEDGDVTQADGPAFHSAAAMMNQLKKDGLLFGVETHNEELNRMLKLNINLLLLLKGGWTRRQRDIYTAYCNLNNQEAVATQLGVSQQNVSKSLQAIKASQVRMLEQDLQHWLDTK